MGRFLSRLVAWAFPPEEPHAIAALDGGPGPETSSDPVRDYILTGSALVAIPPHPRHTALPPTGDPPDAEPS